MQVEKFEDGLIGEKINNRFEIQTLFHKGTSTEVYECLDCDTKATVLLKISSNFNKLSGEIEALSKIEGRVIHEGYLQHFNNNQSQTQASDDLDYESDSSCDSDFHAKLCDNLKRYYVTPKYGENLFGTKNLSLKQILHTGLNISRSLKKVHQGDYTHNKISAKTIVIDNDTLRLVGFSEVRSAIEDHNAPVLHRHTVWATINNQDYRAYSKKSDYLALLKLLLRLYNGQNLYHGISILESKDLHQSNKVFAPMVDAVRAMGSDDDLDLETIIRSVMDTNNIKFEEKFDFS